MTFSYLGSDVELSQSFKKNLQGQILKVFDEEENEYNNARRKKRSEKKKKVRNRSSDEETDSEYSDDEDDKRKRAKRSLEFRTKMNDYLNKEGKFGKMEDIRTPQIRARALDDYHDYYPQSIEFFNDGEEVKDQSNFSSNRSSFRNLDQSFISPRTNVFNESFSSRPSRLESIPEAWLVFPEAGGGGSDKHKDSQQFNNHNTNSNSRLSRAIPVSLRHGIGSRLQVHS